MCRSVPQMPAYATSTSAQPSPPAGRGTSSTATSCPPRQTNAAMPSGTGPHLARLVDRGARPLAGDDADGLARDLGLQRLRGLLRIPGGVRGDDDPFVVDQGVVRLGRLGLEDVERRAGDPA